MSTEEVNYLNIEDSKALSGEQKLQIIDKVFKELNCTLAAEIKYTRQTIVAMPIIVNGDAPVEPEQAEPVQEQADEVESTEE